MSVLERFDCNNNNDNNNNINNNNNLVIYLIAFTIITMLKKTREKQTLEQDTKTRDEGAGHTTERGSKLSVPLRKIHKN